MTSKKAKILAGLKRDIYARIGVSKIKGAGVGIIAIRDIPANTNPFRTNGKDCQAQPKGVPIPSKEIDKLNPEVRKLVYDFIVHSYDKKGNVVYDIPPHGMNSLDISFYLNHSSVPNMKIVYVPGCQYTVFKTKRKIMKGEELTINYAEFD